MMTSPEWIEHIGSASVVFEADASLIPAGLHDDLLRSAAKRALEGDALAGHRRSAFLILTGAGRCLLVLASMWSVAVAVAAARGHHVPMPGSGKVLP